MNKKIVFIIIALILIIFGFGISQRKIPKDDSIKIGAVLGLTGDPASWGEVSKNAALMAVDEINSTGGVNGQRVELVIEDMQSSSKGSISAVSKLINVEHVSAILGPTWLDVYQGSADLVKDTNIIMMSPDAGIEAVNGTTIHQNIFSTWYRTDIKAKMISEYMAKSGVKKLAQIYENDSYYADFSARIKKYAEQNGIQIVATELINPGAVDIRTQAIKIKNSGADAIMFALYDEKATFNFLKTRNDLFLSLPLFGDEFVHDHYSKPEYSGLYENTTYFHASQPNKDFEEKYIARFGSKPIFGAAPSYDAVMILAKMLKEKGASVDYNSYLRSTTFDTVSYGKMTFDEIGGVKTNNNQFDLWKIHKNIATKIN